MILTSSVTHIEIARRNPMSSLDKVTVRELKNMPCILVSSEAEKETEAEYYRTIVKPYSADYNTYIEQAKKDLQSGVRPEVVAMPENMAQYDLVTVMYPNYWGTMPMHMFTVLEQINFEGKTVRPVCTYP